MPVCMALVVPMTADTKMAIATRLSTIVNPRPLDRDGRALFFILFIVSIVELSIKGTLRYEGLKGEIRPTFTSTGMTSDSNNHLGLKRIASTSTEGKKSKIINDNLRSSHREISIAINFFLNSGTGQAISDLIAFTRKKTHERVARGAILRGGDGPRRTAVI